MKKFFLLLSFISPLFLFAQNIGIGTPAPVYKLQVHNPDATSSYMSITNTTTGTTLSDGLLIGMNGSSAIVANIESGELRLGTSNFTRVLIEAGGDVGIGTLTPSAKLDVNGDIKLEGLSLFEFGAGVAGKEVNAGKIGYNAFGQNALTFIGAGTNATNRAVYFFAEGGTTFSGPATVTGNINIGGQLQVNGSAGATGQILTSNGSGDPAWTNSSFGNQVRFAAGYSDDLSTFPLSNTVFSTIYNYSTADITISASIITINKSGLYHIEGYMNANANFSSAPTYLVTDCWVVLDGIQMDQAEAAAMNRSSSSSFNYSLTTKFSQDIYLTGPATIIPRGSVGNVPFPTSRSVSGKITGHLISE